eukprot:5965032-Pyramimonas_sp.AAC.1
MQGAHFSPTSPRKKSVSADTRTAATTSLPRAFPMSACQRAMAIARMYMRCVLPNLASPIVNNVFVNSVLMMRFAMSRYSGRIS